jgi:aryl-alcohol dehydrogenase-like predicted oxidoreductase
MQKRQLGNSKLKVSAIALGCVPPASSTASSAPTRAIIRDEGNSGTWGDHVTDEGYNAKYAS